jgi:(p)ppGpp synthase/HD superfamily hydrolase
MLVLAVNGHKDQFDKGGRPYILHPLRVMHRLRTEDEELQCIAVGHDAVEDCGITYDELRTAGMSERVVIGIKHLTKVPGETYEEYKLKVKSNWDSLRVKREDLRDNSDIRRLKGVAESDFRRLQKYHQFWLELKHIEDKGYEHWLQLVKTSAA